MNTTYLHMSMTSTEREAYNNLCRQIYPLRNYRIELNSIQHKCILH